MLEKLVEKLWGAETNQVELAAKQNAIKSAQQSLVEIFGAKQGRQQLADLLLDWSGRSPSLPVAGFRGCCELINDALSSMVESEPPIFDEIVLCTLDSKGPYVHKQSAVACDAWAYFDRLLAITGGYVTT